MIMLLIIVPDDDFVERKINNINKLSDNLPNDFY